MWLLVGLGNPGREYEGNRHNIGFMAVDAIADYFSFPSWKSKYDGEYTQGIVDGEKVILLKPQTYMNDSGVSVQKLSKFYKIDTSRIVVFYDELDLTPGKIRVKKGGGSGGHNGIRSIDTHMSNKDYWRVRMGIGHPGHKDRVTGYVLNDFSKDEKEWVPKWIDIAAQECGLLLEEKAEQYMTKIARKFTPPGNSKKKSD